MTGLGGLIDYRTINEKIGSGMKSTMSDVDRDFGSQREDELDLYELAANLWHKKYTIISIALLVTVLAGTLAFALPSTWKSETKIFQVDVHNLSELYSAWDVIYDDSAEYSTINPQSVFDDFYRRLLSPKVRWQAFTDSGLQQKALAGVETDDDLVVRAAWQRFQRNITVERSDAQNTRNTDSVSFISVSYTGDDPNFATSMINDYLVPAAFQATKDELTLRLESEKKRQLEKINRRIEQIETQFLESKAVTEVALKEALRLAQVSNMIELPENLNLSRTLGDKSFLLGVDVLQEQLALLESDLKRYYFLSRPDLNSDTNTLLPAIESIVFQKKDKLEQLNPKVITWAPVMIDLPAQVPTSREKPKRLLILVLGMLLGSMLGVFVAMIQVGVESRRLRTSLKLSDSSPETTVPTLVKMQR